MLLLEVYYSFKIGPYGLNSLIEMLIIISHTLQLLKKRDSNEIYLLLK